MTDVTVCVASLSKIARTTTGNILSLRLLKKSRRIRRAGNVACMGETITLHKNFVGILEGNKLLIRL
jgi:hypothetical protein